MRWDQVPVSVLRWWLLLGGWHVQTQLFGAHVPCGRWDLQTLPEPLRCLLGWQDLFQWVSSFVGNKQLYHILRSVVTTCQPLKWFQNVASFTWCWMVRVKQVAPGATMRTWRRAAVVSATWPVPAVQGPWKTTVILAPHLAPNSIRVHVTRIVHLALTMNLQLRIVKVNVSEI